MHYDSPCLIRLKTHSGFGQIQSFLESGQKETLVTETLKERAWRELRKMSLFKSSYHQVTYRLIRVELSTGEPEVLLTTLLSPAFTVADFAWLYSKRWGVETCFDQVKNLLKAPVFSGYSTLACKQDLWSVAIMFNLQTVLITAAEPELKRRCQSRRRTYQINRNVSSDSLKRKLHEVFLSVKQGLENTLEFLLKRFLESLERVVEVVPRPPTWKKSHLTGRRVA